MKKTVCLLLALALTFAFVACGDSGDKDVPARTDAPAETAKMSSTEAFNLCALAYKNISEASLIVKDIGTDVYNAWNIGVQKDDNISLWSLSDEMFTLTEEDLCLGIAYLTNINVWDTMTDEQKEQQSSYTVASRIFASAVEDSDSVFSLCVHIVVGAFTAKGTIGEVEKKLENPKNTIKKLSEKFPDYVHYAAIKGYYDKVASYLNYCKEPTGSFEQLTVTNEGYETTIRDFRSSLEYYFEDFSYTEESEEESDFSFSSMDL